MIEHSTHSLMQSCNVMFAKNSFLCAGVCSRCMTVCRSAVNPFTCDTQQKESSIILDKQVCVEVFLW